MCEIRVKVNCPHCHGTKVVKNGAKRTGEQNFLCRCCGKQFQYKYRYRGADPEVKRRVKRSLLHGCGIRDSSKVNEVSTRTVLKVLRQAGEAPLPAPKRKRYGRVQIDELYSFVSNKGKKVWIFYAYCHETKEILAVTMGKRSAKQLRYLMLKIKHLGIEVEHYCTDCFEGFSAVLPKEKHLAGKEHTKQIEGNHTAIRSKIARLHRRTTKFSKKLLNHWYLFLTYVSYFNELSSYI